MKTLSDLQTERKITILEAKTFWQKFSGLMLKRKVSYALLFRDTAYIHTFFMLFSIDVVFLDKDDNILQIQKNIKPWRIAFPPKETKSVLEMQSR
ncbi:MAG: DUF192 domain-containing protein [Elusimicrobiota bacterium]|jgi:uncharacterized membrane protein (UPF0127 family)|nr:DUF192 domain-containing protein [Elusimicrobiota bacterium]